MSEHAAAETQAKRQAVMRFLPFADITSAELSMARIMRLSLFQISVGMATVLLTGTLNRVMIVELGGQAWMVALMVAIPLLFAPFRALIGHRSDNHVSVFGWRRGPYIWFGSLFQFGGLAVMPFALLVLSGYGAGPEWTGYVGAALAFLLVGAGMHTVQTAGLSLATDIAPPEARPRLVALLFMMLLFGMAISSLFFGLLLRDFSQMRLIQIIQGSAVVTIVLNTIALWKQEGRQLSPRGQLSVRDPSPEESKSTPSFEEAWRTLTRVPGVRRLLIATGLGAGAFGMQDVLLEPYGGEVLGMSVSGTTLLTAVFAIGSIVGFSLPTRLLARGNETHRIAGLGALVGVIGFTAIILSATLTWTPLFVSGVALVGLGGGGFAVCTLISIMATARETDSGIAIGSWGAVQASCTGGAVLLGGVLRDLVTGAASNGWLGPALSGPTIGYSAVYSIEIVLLFAALVAIGPLAKHEKNPKSPKMERLEIQAFPN